MLLVDFIRTISALLGGGKYVIEGGESSSLISKEPEEKEFIEQLCLEGFLDRYRPLSGELRAIVDIVSDTE